MLLIGLEAYFAPTMAIFEQRGAAAPPEAEDDARLSNYFYLGRQDPESFFRRARKEIAAHPVVVFVGDSQGASLWTGEGEPYPKLAARELSWRAPGTAVISLHIGGANSYEQGALLLALLDAGIVPETVCWAHSIFSLRKNEIRQEYVPTYRALGDRAARLVPGVILVGGGEAQADAAGGGAPAAVRKEFERLLTRSATVRFSRRTLWEKGQILRRSPLGRLIPATLLPGTARQLDPPASILRSSAELVAGVTAELTSRGCHVINYLSPINRAAQPRPFTSRAEEVAYTALENGAVAAGGQFLDMLDALSLDRYGLYEDGTPDAFHLDQEGHRLIMLECLTAINQLPR